MESSSCSVGFSIRDIKSHKNVPCLHPEQELSAVICKNDRIHFKDILLVLDEIVISLYTFVYRNNMHLYTHTYTSNTGDTVPHRAAQHGVMLYTLNTAQCLCINTETNENALKSL